MKFCLHSLAFITFLLLQLHSNANDGAFRSEGNQLIPMYETDISVKKEVLTIKRISGNQAVITVYYEFFNPKDDKELEVGFEAYSPSGDVQPAPVNGHHPYISQFTVNLNNRAIPFKVAIVSDSVYYVNGKYKARTVASALKELEDNDYPDFFYVYHFRATFKKGLNILKHTYTIDLSNSIMENYSVDYILTAAKRWANRQIDDFTLQIDMGEWQDLCIQNTFFKNASEWQIQGNGHSVNEKAGIDDSIKVNTSRFYIKSGALLFQKKDFKPADELHVTEYNYYYYYTPREDGSDFKFDSRLDNLPFSFEDPYPYEPANDLSRRILRNLPFARRGYVFKVPEIKAYYERQRWYVPDPNYTPDVSKLSKKEQEWLKMMKLQ